MKTKLFSTKTTSILTAIVIFTGCSQMPQNIDIGDKTKAGTAIGAAAGAVLGNIMKKDTKGTVTGATIGSVIGGVIGYNMDKQAAEIAKTLETVVDTSPNAEATSNSNVIVTKNDRFVKITFRDKMMFSTNSAALTSTARYKVNKLINILQNYPQSIVQVVGHTDNRGSHSHNLTLSQKRSRGVANLIRNSGVQNQVLESGCSFDKPVAPNTTSHNMGLNRRVEIFLYPSRNLVVNRCI